MDQSGEHPEQSGEYPPEMGQSGGPGEEGEYYEGEEGQEGEYPEGEYPEGYEPQEGEYPEGYEGQEGQEGEYPEGEYPEGYEPQEGEEMMMRSGMEEGQSQMEGHNMTGQQQSHMEGHDGQQGDEEEEEDPYRKIKADLLDTINARRKESTLDQLRTDIIMQAMAEEYVMYLADNNEPDPSVLKQLSENHLNHGDYEFVMVKAKFEDETDLSPEIIASTFIDSCFVWFEVNEDRLKLMKKEYNAIGLGAIATMECVYAVVVLGERQISLTKVCNGEDGGIEVRGRMNTSAWGVYAVRLYNPETNKDIIAVGPEAIEMDRIKREFIVFLECEDTIQASAKMLEFYVRNKPETIGYKVKRADKLKLSDVTLTLRAPCVLFPDAKALAAEERDRARREAERMAKQKQDDEAKRRRDAENAARRERKRQRRQDLEEARARGDDVESIYSSTVRSEQSFISKQSLTNPAALEAAHRSLQREKEEQAAANESPNKMSVSHVPDDQGQSMDEQRMQESIEEERRMQQQFQQRPEVIKDQGISNKEIREELEKAIGEAEKQLSELEHQNAVLQEKIVTFRKKNEAMMGEKQGDVTMNPHKYLNTLAHVHQIGLELQQTKERYNKMTADLEKNLKEKKRKCNEIKEAFMRLKREVSKKAAFSRTDKPIPEQLVEDLEQKEVDKDKELYTLRLQILSLRNNLAKNQKIIKKKEELAEGLHLIDYEQLKIENQTLNEKIEERNEDLHKLKKKNTMTVQVLTHTKEKLQFVSTKIAVLEQDNNVRENEMKDLTTKLNDAKKERDGVRKDNTSLRQQTGIVNSNVLRNDHGNLKAQNKALRDQHMELKRKHEYMIEIINEFNRLKKLEDTNNHQSTNGRRLK